MKNSLYFTLIAVVICTVTCDRTYPCENDLSVDCLRNYFKEHGECNLVNSPKQNLSYDVPQPNYLPFINTTVISTKLNILGLDGNIETMYVDDSTGNLVISVKFHELVVKGPECIVSVSVEDAEPRVVKTEINATYPVVLTAVIKLMPGKTISTKSLTDALISAYFLDTNGVFNIGPEFSASDDPVISAAYNKLTSNFPLALKEVFRTNAAYYFFIYLQNYICDFGVAPNAQCEYDTTVVQNILDSKNKEHSIVEPCSDGDDMRACVANYFVENGQCSNVGTPDDDEPVTREILTTYIPAFNTTAVVLDALLLKLKGQINKFYINKVSNNLVLSVTLPNFVLKSSFIPAIVSQRGELPVVATDSQEDYYPETLCAVIPLNDDLTPSAVANAYVSGFPLEGAYIRTGNFYGAANGPPVIASLMEGLQKHPMLAIKETMVTVAPSIFRAYLQKYICDFSLSLTSV